MRHAPASRVAVAGIGIGLAILLAALAVALSQGVGQPDAGRTDIGGAQAVEFTAPLFGGGDFVLADSAEQPVFIYFWASWCVPCEEEAPVIERLWPEYRDRGYQFVGVNIWDLPADAERFIAEHGLTFPLARDAERSVYVEYGVQALPVGFFIEPGLSIRSRYDGPLDEARLRSELDALAGEQS